MPRLPMILKEEAILQRYQGPPPVGAGAGRGKPEMVPARGTSGEEPAGNPIIGQNLIDSTFFLIECCLSFEIELIFEYV